MRVTKLSHATGHHQRNIVMCLRARLPGEPRWQGTCDQSAKGHVRSNFLRGACLMPLLCAAGFWDHFKQSSGELPAWALRLPHELAEVVLKTRPSQSQLSVLPAQSESEAAHVQLNSPAGSSKDTMPARPSMDSGEDAWLQRHHRNTASLLPTKGLLRGPSHLAAVL